MKGWGVDGGVWMAERRKSDGVRSVARSWRLYPDPRSSNHRPGTRCRPRVASDRLIDDKYTVAQARFDARYDKLRLRHCAVNASPLRYRPRTWRHEVELDSRYVPSLEHWLP